LVASGKFWVWSITWEDVESAIAGKLDTVLADGLDAMCFNPKELLPPSLRSMLSESLLSNHALAVLVQWLGTPTGETGDQQVMKMARHAGATAFRMVPNPTKPELKEAQAKLDQFWEGFDDLQCDRPQQSVPCGNLNDLSLTLRYYWPHDLVQVALPIPNSPGYILLNEACLGDDIVGHLLWRRWLWLFNIYQMLPGVFLATQAGLENRDYSEITVITGVSKLSGGNGVANASAWERVIEEAMDDLRDGLNTLSGEGFPPPDAVGYELEEAGNVVAEAELVWEKQQIVLLMPAHGDSEPIWISKGWKAVMAEGEWPKRVADTLSL
jgi:DEAD/DEAH box helicase domain-containing protein